MAGNRNDGHDHDETRDEWDASQSKAPSRPAARRPAEDRPGFPPSQRSRQPSRGLPPSGVPIPDSPSASIGSRSAITPPHSSSAPPDRSSGKTRTPSIPRPPLTPPMTPRTPPPPPSDWDDERPSARYRAMLEERRRRADDDDNFTTGSIPTGRTGQSGATPTPSRPISAVSRPRETGAYPRTSTSSRPIDRNTRQNERVSRPLPAVMHPEPSAPRSPTGWLAGRTPTGWLPLLNPPQVVRRYAFDPRRSPIRTFLRQISVSGAVLLAIILIAMSAAPSDTTLASPLTRFSATYGSALFPSPTPQTPPGTFGGTSGSTNPVTPPAGTAPAPVVAGIPAPVTALHIVGNQMYDGAGRRVTFRGTSRWSLEFDCKGDGHFNVQDYKNMQTWGFNVVRIPLNSTYWLAGDGGGCSAQQYQNTVKNAVKNAESVGIYVILVGQWSVNRGNSLMAYPQDRQFLKELALTYKDDYNVGFIPVTEPHDVTWNEWYSGWNGGPGMKECVDILNANAPGHIIFVNGLGWANDTSFLTNGHAITGPNIAYEVHIYQYWNPSRFDGLIDKYVIIGGEFGINDCCHDYVTEVMAYFEAHHTGYESWAWADGQDVLLLRNVNDPNSATPMGQRIKDFTLAHQGQ